MATKKTRLTADSEAYEQILSQPGAVKASDIPAPVGIVGLTPEELEVLNAFRARRDNPAPSAPPAGINDLVQAFVSAINQTKPVDKAKPYQRKKICKRCGQDHRENIRLKRTWFQHGGIELRPELFCNVTLELLNRVKPGVYLNGLVQVRKRKDRAYDITWAVRTNAQRLRVIDEASRRTGLGQTFEAILTACIDEFNDPKRFRGPDDDD